ncbi:MAG: D-alanine--D-alanine ligase family protein [Gemmatimonadaceae bacterium]
MKKLRVLALMHPQLVPPDSLEGQSDKDINTWKTEFDVVHELRGRGHEVRPLGVQYELAPVREAVESFQPHVVFNLLEEFHGEVVFDHNVVSYLELLRIPYTGCNPRGMILSRGKALSKKLCAYHRIRVPEFGVFPMGRKVRRPAHLQFPLIVKSLIEHASVGIARASIVDSDDKLAERVRFIHEKIGTDAIAEQFIDGRELYVSVVGNERLVAFPTWELVADKRSPDEPLIATARAKHDLDYQERHGIDIRPADLPPELAAEAAHVSKRIYRILELTGYARLDFRLDPQGHLYFLEANPNPEIAQKEEFASSARHAGVEYPELLERILRLGLRQRA